jgi:hypothetical protein
MDEKALQTKQCKSEDGKNTEHTNSRSGGHHLILDEEALQTKTCKSEDGPETQNIQTAEVAVAS